MQHNPLFVGRVYRTQRNSAEIRVRNRISLSCNLGVGRILIVIALASRKTQRCGGYSRQIESGVGDDQDLADANVVLTADIVLATQRTETHLVAIGDLRERVALADHVLERRAR